MRGKLLNVKSAGVFAVLLALFLSTGLAGESAPELKTITVRTAQEFLDAIGSNTTILLEEGLYNLSETDPYELSNDHIAWEDVWRGKELCIRNIRNLTIRGESPGCRIVVDPRGAEVMRFLECAGITVESITLGHTLQSEVCDGGVLYFEDCSDIRVIDTYMFGCGTYGITFDGVDGASVESSSIYECAEGVVNIKYSTDIAFTDCVFRDTEGGVVMKDAQNVTFDRCQFINLYGEALFCAWDCSNIAVRNSSFFQNRVDVLHASGPLRYQNNTFAGNWFDEPEPDEAALPAEAAKVFEGAEWDGYEPIATRYYQWPGASLVFTVMQKEGHNALCLLVGSGGMDAFRLALSNDRALYQDSRVPSLFIDDGMGFLCFEYTDGNAAAGSPGSEAYVFCSRWYWEQEMERTADGDWEYMLLDAYRLYPAPYEPGYPYDDATHYSMDITETGLRLQSRVESYGGSWETLTETEACTAHYDLAAFDIARCNADYEALLALAGITFEDVDN